MNWDIYKAKDWLMKTGMDHIKGGLYAEGGELIYESKWGEASSNRQKFIDTLKRICFWEDEDIEEAIKDIFRYKGF
jgi:hypothetical protein